MVGFCMSLFRVSSPLFEDFSMSILVSSPLSEDFSILSSVSSPLSEGFSIMLSVSLPLLYIYIFCFCTSVWGLFHFGFFTSSWGLFNRSSVSLPLIMGFIFGFFTSLWGLFHLICCFFTFVWGILFAIVCGLLSLLIFTLFTWRNFRTIFDFLIPGLRILLLHHRLLCHWLPAYVCFYDQFLFLRLRTFPFHIWFCVFVWG